MGVVHGPEPTTCAPRRPGVPLGHPCGVDDEDAARVAIRPAGPQDSPWAASLLAASWGSSHVARRGQLIDASSLPALVALDGERRCGLATYRRDGAATELVTIDADPTGRGIGTRLLRAIARQEAAAGARRLWLVTTNDNLDALRFYQRRGLRLVAVHPGGAAVSRRLKPTIPEVGRYGIEIRDELELALVLPATW